MSEQKQVTSPEDYRKLFSTEPKLVNLPSGAVFKIKQVDVVSFIISSVLPAGFVSGDESASNVNKRVNEEMQKVDYRNLEQQLIVASVVEPLLSIEKKDGFLSLDELSPSDRTALTIEVTKLHGLDRQSREIVEPFRKTEQLSAS